MSQRPLPVPDDISAPFWAAAAEHQLTLPRCARCGMMSMPPDVTCPHCLSTEPDFRFEAVAGSGWLRSWTIVRRSFVRGFEADLPFVLADVELETTPPIRLIGRLLDGPDAPLQAGAPVVLAFEDLAPGVAVPAFALAAAP